jgi:hypothetical protein
MKVRKTVKYGFAVLAGVLLLIAVTAPVRAKVVLNEMVPVTWILVIPCSGDEAVLDGYMHTVVAETVDADGGIHVKMHYQPASLQGIVVSGPNTGAKYNGAGVTQDQFNIKKGETYTYINNYRFIGQGRAPNLSIHETWHITVNANGEITAEPINVKITCK